MAWGAEAESIGVGGRWETGRGTGGDSVELEWMDESRLHLGASFPELASLQRRPLHNDFRRHCGAEKAQAADWARLSNLSGLAGPGPGVPLPAARAWPMTRSRSLHSAHARDPPLTVHHSPLTNAFHPMPTTTPGRPGSLCVSFLFPTLSFLVNILALLDNRFLSLDTCLFQPLLPWPSPDSPRIHLHLIPLQTGAISMPCPATQTTIRAL